MKRNAIKREARRYFWVSKNRYCRWNYPDKRFIYMTFREIRERFSDRMIRLIRKKKVTNVECKLYNCLGTIRNIL